MIQLRNVHLLLALATAACSGIGHDGDFTQRDNDQSAQSAAPAGGSGYTATKYPVVLAHGLFGWKSVLGAAEYWYGIASDLEASGAKVFVTEVTAANSSEVRGEQLLAQIEKILAQTGATKVNLIGHSQGGVDVRYVLGVRPDLIASVTAVAGVQRGAAFADFILDNITPGGFSEKLVAALGNGVGRLMDLVTGKELTTPQDFMAALHTLSSAGSVPFNTRFPAGLSASPCGSTPTMSGAIPLFSWIGSAQMTNWRDPGDLAFSLTSLVYDEDNDGLVGRCSSHFGKVLRDDYAMNHLDEINQFAGLVSSSETSPVEVFRAHVNRLKSTNL